MNSKLINILKEVLHEKKAEVGDVDILPHILSLCEYMDNHGIKIRPYPKINLSKDESYKKDPMGKTAWYEPNTKEVTLITSGRHPKDVLRSAAHELVHHAQNLRGDMKDEDTSKLADPKYAQNDDTLKKLEAEAYLQGNMIFREWEDQYK